MMRGHALLIALLLAAPGLASAQGKGGSALDRAKTVQSGSDAADEDQPSDSGSKGMASVHDAVDKAEESMQEDDGPKQALVAKLFLTRNPNGFIAAWKAGSNDLPTTTLIGQANPVVAMIAISGCSRGKDGKCNIQLSSRTSGPDGQFDTPHSGPPWQPAPMGAKSELAPANFGLRLGPGDPPGRYTVEVKVTDLVAKTNRTISASVTKPAAAEGR